MFITVNESLAKAGLTPNSKTKTHIMHLFTYKSNSNQRTKATSKDRDEKHGNNSIVISRTSYI